MLRDVAAQCWSAYFEMGLLGKLSPHQSLRLTAAKQSMLGMLAREVKT